MLNYSEIEQARQLLDQAGESLPHDYEDAAQRILAARSILQGITDRIDADHEAEYQQFLAEAV